MACIFKIEKLGGGGEGGIHYVYSTSADILNLKQSNSFENSCAIQYLMILKACHLLVNWNMTKIPDCIRC